MDLKRATFAGRDIKILTASSEYNLFAIAIGEIRPTLIAILLFCGSNFSELVAASQLRGPNPLPYHPKPTISKKDNVLPMNSNHKFNKRKNVLTSTKTD